MALQSFSTVELLQGLFGLIWVIIAFLIGIRITYKGITLERKDLIAVGLTYILVSSAWWGVAVQFVSYGFFNIQLSNDTYLFIANLFIGWGLILWLYAFCEVFYPNYKKIIVLCTVVFALAWDIFLIYALITNPQMIAVFNGIFDTNHAITSLLFILSAIIVFLISGIIFSYKFIKTENSEIKLKGYFLLIAWISFTIGAILDAALPMNVVLVVVVRLLLISTAVEYYFGFFLPKSLSKRLSKK